MLFRIFFTVGFCLIVIGGKAQTKKFLKDLQNDKINYFVSTNYPNLLYDDPRDTIPLKTVVIFNVSLDNHIERYSRELVIKWLVSLLDDPKRDWAANLSLYALMYKSAILIEAECNTEEAWRKNCAEEDKAYWKDKVARTTD